MYIKSIHVVYIIHALKYNSTMLNLHDTFIGNNKCNGMVQRSVAKKLYISVFTYRCILSLMTYSYNLTFLKLKSQHIC